MSRYDGGATIYSYTYNALGYLTSISKNGTVVAEYEYDALGQLVCEEYPADLKAYVYTYDKAGNITGKYEFPYYQGTLAGDYLNYLTQYKVTLGSYTYSTSSWGDLLTNYNGTAITYDAIGNPLNWRNAVSLIWDKRELAMLTLAQDETLSFTYNSSGIRTQKNYTNINEHYGVTHDYLLDGTTIIKETILNSFIYGTTVDTLYYYYDESGVTGFEYNGARYHYIKNLQGDIVEIYDADGHRAVQYTYDAWGKVLSITGTLASTVGQINPFRYRGYYYDTETGLYYLQSRYYDPVVGRFLNADGIIGANGGILGYNMFAYCNNNPVVFVDHMGFCSVMVREMDAEGPFGCIIDVSCGSNFYDMLSGYEFKDFCMCEDYDKLMDFIGEKESYTANMSLDLEGEYSIGYGHKIQKNDTALISVFGTSDITRLSKTQARLLLWYDICAVGMRKVDNYSEEIGCYWYSYQYYALVSVAYNSNYKYKELMDNLAYGIDPMTAFLLSAEGNRPNVINGIRNRRCAEAKIYLYGF